MAETKYGKHILRDAFKTHHQLESLSANGDELDADCIITHQGMYKPELMLKEGHKHDFHQILCFIGGDTMNVRDFGAEVEICLGEEGEKHIIDSTTIVSMPPGLVHGPLNFKKVAKPIIFLEIMLTRQYGRETVQ